jgi:DNA topoisomerase VI subunit A
LKTKTEEQENINAIRNDVKVYLKTQNKEDISIIMGEDGKYYAFIPDFITSEN